MGFRRPVVIGLSPNTESDDVWTALHVLTKFFRWKSGGSLQIIRGWFQKKFPAHEVFLFNSARSAEFALLNAYGIGPNDEVLVQAFSCVAVVNSILWSRAKPVYVDVERSSLGMDPKDAEKKITKKTKAIIIQHTFGIPTPMEPFQKLARDYNLVLIEDCAHALDVVVDSTRLGTFGDSAFFSFGRDKCLSSVFGGAAIISKSNTVVRTRLHSYWHNLSYPSNFWIFQQLLHPIAFSIILPLYNLLLGRIILVLLQKIHLLSFPIYPEEKEGKKPSVFPAKYPNALASLLVKQLTKNDRYKNVRQTISKYYAMRLNDTRSVTTPLLRYPYQISKPKELQLYGKSKGVHFGRWYSSIIDPAGTNYKAIRYDKHSCPIAEELALGIINLPTRVSEKDAEKIVSMVLKFT